MPAIHTQGHLSLHVEPHKRLGSDPFFWGSLKIKGDLQVDHNLQGGDRLTITVSDADGNVISTALATCGTPSFKDIKEKGTLIGTERVHTAELTGE